MKVVYATQDPPETIRKSVFLIGPSPRGDVGESWRPAMIEALQAAGYDGVIYVPEPEDGIWPETYLEQISWEQKYLAQCDLILAWVPRDLQTMPAFTTNVEFGDYLDSGKLIYGRPKGAPKTRYLDALYKERWNRKPLSSLEEMAVAAVNRIGEGSARSGGERAVPLEVWRSKQFQDWYEELRYAGNRLDDAKLLWSFYVGPQKQFLFCFTLWVDVWVESENRHKSNEFIFSRTDISTIVAYHIERNSAGEVRDIHILLVKEFRSPARTADGFIHELPGGSSFEPSDSPLRGLLVPAYQVASHELEEETSLKIDPKRFRMLSSRQLAGTLSTHQAVVFTVRLTAAELDQAKKLEQSGQAFGVKGDSEQTYVEVGTLYQILESNLLDWSQLGMVFQALHEDDLRGWQD